VAVRHLVNWGRHGVVPAGYWPTWRSHCRLSAPGPGPGAAAYSRLKQTYHDLGGVLQDPFMALSFLALPVIPALKLTDLGLVDVDRFQVVSLGHGMMEFNADKRMNRYWRPWRLSGLKTRSYELVYRLW
jgi:hypothetical protein